MSDGLSIVIPVFNEQSVLESLINRLEESIVVALPAVEVVVLDDASTDGSGHILDQLSARRPWLTVEHATKNTGHGPAVCRAVAASSREWIFQIDSDDQFDISDFWLLWSRRDDFDLILGRRNNRDDPQHRLILSRSVSWLITSLVRRRIYDSNTPFRIFRRSLWEAVQPGFPTPTLIPSILLTVGAVSRQARVVEVPVRHRPRTAGTSSLRALRLARFCLGALGQLVAYRVALVRQDAPLVEE